MHYKIHTLPARYLLVFFSALLHHVTVSCQTHLESLSTMSRSIAPIHGFISIFIVPLSTTAFLHQTLTRHYLLSAMSSILRIILTVSAASSMALVLTSSGCRTFSFAMLALTPPVLMLTPALRSPSS